MRIMWQVVLRSNRDIGMKGTITGEFGGVLIVEDIVIVVEVEEVEDMEVIIAAAAAEGEETIYFK